VTETACLGLATYYIVEEIKTKEAKIFMVTIAYCSPCYLLYFCVSVLCVSHLFVLTSTIIFHCPKKWFCAIAPIPSIFNIAFLLAMSSYTVKAKASDIPVPNWDVTYQTLPGREIFFYGVGCLNLLLWRSKCTVYCMYSICVCIKYIFSAHYQRLPLHKKDST
jgi:hypothetical protein